MGGSGGTARGCSMGLQGKAVFRDARVLVACFIVIGNSCLVPPAQSALWPWVHGLALHQQGDPQ